MLAISFCITLIIGVTSGAIEDLNCTYVDGQNKKFAENAVVCPNVLADSVCAKLYPTEAKVHDAADRDASCYKNAANAVDAAFKEAAIKNCPRRCGYCCVTPEYDCPNKLFPRISCSAITRDMCYNSFWMNIIAEDCPSVCGFCKTGNCTDVAPNCARDLSICRNMYMQDFVKENCKKTCGLCSETGTTTTSPSDCGSDPNCANWVRNGFCNSNFYTQEQKKKYCGKMCLLC